MALAQVKSHTYPFQLLSRFEDTASAMTSGPYSSLPMPALDLLDVGDVRKELQDEIAVHLHIITQLETRLNALLPIFRLPNEVLSEIFQHYKASMDGVKINRGVFSHFHWITITHVCHHWREVALYTPSLWTSFVLTHLEFMEEFMARSKQMPLTIRAVMYDDHRLPSMRAVLSEIHHVHTLDLALSKQVYDKLGSDIPSAAPLLNSLTLRSDGTSSATTPMPTIFNECHVPSLQHLTLSGYQLTWSANILASTLTRLEVTCWGRYAAPCSAILDALIRMTALEYIDLSGCVTPIPLPEASPSTCYPVTMSHLRYLGLHTSSIAMTRLLDCLIVPSSCRIVLCLRTTYAVTETPLAPLSRSVLSKISGETTIGQMKSFRSFAIWKELPTTVILALWTDIQPVGLLDCHSSTPDIQISIQLYPPDPEDVIELCSTLPLQDVEVFSLAHVPCDLKPETSWAMLFVQLPKVTTLRIHSGAAEDMHRMLTSCSESVTAVAADRRKEYHIPDLKMLMLDNVRFREPDDPDDDTFLEDLMDALRVRRDAGVHVGQLVVEACINMGERDIRRLGSVTDVIWDGAEHQEDIDLPEDNFLRSIGLNEMHNPRVFDYGAPSTSTVVHC